MAELRDLEKGFNQVEIDLSEAFGQDFKIVIQEPDYALFADLSGLFSGEGEVDTNKALGYVKRNLKKFIVEHNVTDKGKKAKIDSVVKIISGKMEVFTMVSTEIIRLFDIKKKTD